MLVQIEFFRSTPAKPEGTMVRVNKGQFANVEDAETYGRLNLPNEADGFRIVVDGRVRETVAAGSARPHLPGS
jgi:hypothetical protein